MTLNFLDAESNVTTVTPTASSYVNRQVMGDCTAYIEVFADAPLPIYPGHAVYIFGHAYFVRFPLLPLRDGQRLKYQFTVYGTVHELERAMFFISDSTELDDVAKTSWFCTPLEFLTQLLVNLQRVMPGSWWEIGSCAIAKAQTLELNNNNCLEALIAAADLFDLHYDVTELTISLDKIESADTIDLGVGKGLGLREIVANKSNEKDIITKLYAYGSDKNNPFGQRLTIPPVVWPGAETIIEAIHEFNDIYPKIESEILTIYGGYPDVMQSKPLGFLVNDYLIAGRTPQLRFLTGELAGLDFRFTNPISDQFNIVSFQLSPGVVVPGAPGYNYADGDKFLIWNIAIPPAYYEAAQDELEAAALEFLANSQAKVKLNLTTDELYFRRNSTVIDCGMKVKVSSDIIPEFASPGVECEVLGYKRNICEPHKYDMLTVGDVLLNRPFENRVERVVERTILKQTEVITGVSDKNYTHVQVEDSVEWIVRHNLEKHPSVTVTGFDLIEREGKVTYLGPMMVKINFSKAISGVASCN